MNTYIYTYTHANTYMDFESDQRFGIYGALNQAQNLVGGKDKRLGKWSLLASLKVPKRKV